MSGRPAQTYGEQNGSPAYRQTINQAFLRLNQARSYFWEDMSRSGEPSSEIHHEFELALMDVYELLRPYKIEEEAIRKIWDQSNLDALPKLCFQQESTTEVSVTGGRVKEKKKTDITHAQPDTLVNASEAFDLIAYKLGFLPTPSTSRKKSKLSTNAAEKPIA